MATMKKMLEHIQLPRVAKVRCEFDRSEITDVAAAMREELSKTEIARRIKPGMRIAIGVGLLKRAERP